MEIVKNHVDDLNAILTIQVSPEDYKEKVKQVYRDLGKRVNLKGFRPGKVPVSVIKRMYGRGVVLEELNKAISESLNSYIKEELDIVGEPLPVQVDDIDLDPEANKDYSFDYEVGLAPQFELNFDLKDLPPLYNVTIDQETLDNEIDHIRLRHGDMSNPEVSEEGDVLYGKITQVGEDGKPMAEGEGLTKMLAMNPTRVLSDEVKAQMGGKKDGDTLTIQMSDLHDNDFDLRRFWETNVKGEQIREVDDEMLESIKGMTFSFEVKKINHFDRAELNEELFEKEFPGKEIKTEEDFIEAVKENMQGFFNKEARKFFNSKRTEALLEQNEIPLPEDFLKKFLLRTDKRVTEGNLDKNAESYFRSLRWSLVVDKLQNEDESLKVNEEDIRARALQKVNEEILPMIPGATEDHAQAYVQYYMQDQNQVNQLFQDVLNDRINGFLDDKVAMVEEETSAKDFMDMIKNQ